MSKIRESGTKVSKMEIVKVDPEKEEDPLELEGKNAFDILNSLIQKSKKPPEEPAIKPKKHLRNYKQLPSCLMKMIEEGTKKFPCTLCGKLFSHPDQLVVHANLCTKPNPQAECCFCGMCFGDLAKLSLHQMAIPLMHKCYNCFKVLENFNELNHHCCERRSKYSRINTGLVCKLGCSKERQFETKEALELHLLSLHGASMDDDPANNDAMKFCVMCRGYVNAYRLSLEDHVYFRCTARHPWVKEQIHGLYKLAKEQNLDLGMLIQLELEGQMEEWKARDNMRVGTQGGLIRVLPGVNNNIVTKCLKAADIKYNPNEPQFLLPIEMTLQQLREMKARRDTIKIFHLWNKVVKLNFDSRKPTQKLSDEFTKRACTSYKNLSASLPQLNDEKKRFKIPKVKGGKVYKNLEKENAPNQAVLKRIQMELGTMVSPFVLGDPCRSDRIALTSISKKVRDLENDNVTVGPQRSHHQGMPFDASDYTNPAYTTIQTI